MKIFLSSTIHDLKYLRSILVRSLEKYRRHKVIASEQGTIPVNPGRSSYEQCLEAIVECDCLIAIVGGRFGGEYPIGSNRSITEAEIEQSWNYGKKTLVFVENSVWVYRSTQRSQGKGKNGVPYESARGIVDDSRVLEMIDRIADRPTDNWIFTFYSDTDLLKQIRAQIRPFGSAVDSIYRWAGSMADSPQRLAERVKRNVCDLQISFSLGELPKSILERLQANIGHFPLLTNEIIENLELWGLLDFAELAVDLIELT
jgi:Domain of unknown function (DUF4062)